MDIGLSGETLFHSFLKDVLLEGYVGEGVFVVQLHASFCEERCEFFTPFFGIVGHIVHPAEYAV